MSGQSQLVLMIAAVHLLGLAAVAALIIPALRDPRPEQPDADSDEGRGNRPLLPSGPTIRPRGGVPLPDARSARVRLREHGRLADRLPPSERRPVREPARDPRPSSPRRVG